MVDIVLYDKLSENVLIFAISAIRVAMAFLVAPIFTEKLIPALVRNSIFLMIAIVVVYLQPKLDFDEISALYLIGLFAKEVFIGLAIGFFLCLFIWAFEAAGMVIDNQIGAAIAKVYDPISGHSVTLYGELISRFVNYLFMSTGGLLLLTVAIMESYSLWPVNQAMPELSMASMALFESQFSSFFVLIVTLSAPVVAVMFLIDMSMGLMNRFAKRLDVFFISMAIKGLVALLLVVVMVPVLMEIFFIQLDLRNNGLSDYLQGLLPI